MLKNLRIVIFCLILLLGIGTVNGIFADNDTKTDENTQTKPNDDFKNDEQIAELDKLDFDNFCWSGYLNKDKRKICAEIDKKHFKTDRTKILELHPRMSFYRMLRYYILENKIGFIDKCLKEIVKIIDAESTIEYHTKEMFEKLDLFILAAARIPELFDTLWEKTQKDLVHLTFRLIEFRDYWFRFAEALQDNQSSNCVSIIIDLILDNETEYLVQKFPDGNDFIYCGRMIDYTFTHYDPDFKYHYFEMYETHKPKCEESKISREIVSSIEWADDYLENNDDFFEKYYFSGKDDFFIFSLDPSLIRSGCFKNEHLTLNFRKCRFLYNVYLDELKKTNNIESLRRILCYVSTENWCDCDYSSLSFSGFRLTEDYLEIISKIKSINTIKKKLYRSFQTIMKDCFVEYKTQFIVRDGLSRLSDPESEDPYGTKSYRKLYKWKPNEIGYGSPTYSTDCFLNWNENKFKYPEYKNLRKQYLDFQKQYMANK